jgi:hypothetical protein
MPSACFNDTVGPTVDRVDTIYWSTAELKQKPSSMKIQSPRLFAALVCCYVYRFARSDFVWAGKLFFCAYSSRQSESRCAVRRWRRLTKPVAPVSSYLLLTSVGNPNADLESISKTESATNRIACESTNSFHLRNGTAPRHVAPMDTGRLFALVKHHPFKTRTASLILLCATFGSGLGTLLRRRSSQQNTVVVLQCQCR